MDITEKHSKEQAAVSGRSSKDKQDNLKGVSDSATGDTGKNRLGGPAEQ